MTREEIKKYVRDELEGNDAFRKRRRTEERYYDQLVNELVYKARGVFL